MGERAVAVAVRRALLRACASLDRSPDLRYLMIRDGAGPAGPFRREEVEEGRPAAVAVAKYLALRPRGAGPAAGAPPSAVRLAAEGYRAEAGGRWQEEGALVHDALRALRYARTFLSCPGTAKVAEGGMGFGRAWDPSAEDEGAYLHRELEAQRERLVLERLAASDGGRPGAPPAARRGGRRSPRGRRRRLLFHVLPRVIDLIDGGARAAGSAAAGRPASRRQRRRNKRRLLRDEMTDREA